MIDSDTLTDELYEPKKLLLDIEGTILAYWTDVPESVLDDLRIKIRKFLDDFELK